MLGTRNQVILRPNTTTTISSVGNTVRSVGTLSHPTPDSTYGWTTNFASAATGNVTAGTGNNAVIWRRGAASTDIAGFFQIARIGFPDASYNESGASTGRRIFVGLTSNTLAAMASSDAPTGDWVGFWRVNVNGGLTHTNWRFGSRDNVTTTSDDTGLAFVPQQLYQLAIYCPPGGSEIFWRIDNLNTGASAQGSKATNLPRTTINMRGGFQVGIVQALACNVRMGILVVEDAQ
jgi:hypothetical protein